MDPDDATIDADMTVEMEAITPASRRNGMA